MPPILPAVSPQRDDTDIGALHAFSAWRSLIARPLTLAFAALASLGGGFLSERTAEPSTTQYVVWLGPRIAAS
jgi:hypothetical protein